ncbi:MAG: SH3 domain-containing protein [Lachnospiraceae bacterium]|nr:SH3 domain-containing protein [Lachnospiraceae bacterium]
MKYAMYAIMALLTVMIIILAYMNANKPPAVQTNTIEEEAKTTEREIFFNLTPIPDENDSSQPLNLFAEEEDEEEVEEDDDPDITRLYQMMYATSAVNLRAGPGTDFERVGSLSANQEVRVIGQSISSSWYKIEHGDGAAFVSSSFLALVEE